MSYNRIGHLATTSRRMQKALGYGLEGERRRCLQTSACNRFKWGKKEEPKATTDPKDRIGGFAQGVAAKDIVLASQPFSGSKDKDRETFLTVVEEFGYNVKKHRQGQVEFIYGAMRHLKDYGLHKDLEAYKAIMDVFPKERMKPTNFMQLVGIHFVKHQWCAIDLLDEMEQNGVCPDAEMERLVVDIFSRQSFVWRKVARQLYWFSKFKNSNPYPLPENMPLDALELARIALKRMCVDLQTKILVYSTARIQESLDKTWIVSAQSPSQQELLSELKPRQPVYVEGSFRVWLKELSISYFILRSDPLQDPHPWEAPFDEDPLDVSEIPLNVFGKPKKNAVGHQRSLHQQTDGTVLAICATGTSSRDSLLSWVRLLETTNPKLKDLQVIFTVKSPTTQLETINEHMSPENNEEINESKESTAT